MVGIAPRVAVAVLLASLLSACGGGKDTPVEPPPVQIPTAAIALGAATGTVQAGNSTTIAVTVTRGGGFAGDVALAVTGAPDGVTVSAQTVAAGSTVATLTVVATTAAVAGPSTLTVAGTGTGVTIAAQSVALTVTAPVLPIAQIGSDISNGDIQFGGAIALSSDGTRMVVGASQSANGTTRVYQRAGTAWTQIGADIIGEGPGEYAGNSVAISAGGTRIAIGAFFAQSNGIFFTGHVRVYDLIGGTWTQVGADIDGQGLGVQSGSSVAMSGSGSRLIVGARTGSARVFDLVGTTWTQVGATFAGGGQLGDAVDISTDGTTIAISAPAGGSGSVSVYRLVGGAWVQVGNTMIGNQLPGPGSFFGDAISLTANGSRIAVSSTKTREGVPANDPRFNGQVRVFDLVGSTWTQVGANVNGGIDTLLTRNSDSLGETLMISDDGTRFAATIANNSEAKVYTLVSGAWVQTGATITVASGAGLSVRSEGLALAADGRTLAIGYVNGSPRRVRTFSIAP